MIAPTSSSHARYIGRKNACWGASKVIHTLAPKEIAARTYKAGSIEFRAYAQRTIISGGKTI
jgi:hypothetical protein